MNFQNEDGFKQKEATSGLQGKELQGEGMKARETASDGGRGRRGLRGT